MGLVPEHIHHDWDSCPVISHHHLISQLCTVQGEKLWENMRTWNIISIQSARKSADEFVIISVNPEVIERCTGKSIINGHGKIIDKNCGFSSKPCLIEGLSTTNNHSECLLTIY
jgi:hypothetical protein